MPSPKIVNESATKPHRAGKELPRVVDSPPRMPIEMKRYPFTRPVIDYAPDDIGGVYVLWDGDEVIYIGRSGGSHNIRSCLLEHLEGARGSCTTKASHYSGEITLWDSARETELLALFAKEHSRDPRCQQAA